MSIAAKPASGVFDVERVRADFPILAQKVHGKPLVYLDNAATSQKPRAVIDAMSGYYEGTNANIHRAVHLLSEQATEEYEAARATVQKFINAASPTEIIFVRGTTEGINLVAQTYGRAQIHAGDEVIVTDMEHHSDIVPWQLLCEDRGAKLRVVPINDRGELILEEYAKLLGPKTKLVCVTHVSNALGTINPVRKIVDMAHSHGIPVLVDGAQAVPHLKVDVQALDCDFYSFSGHKVYGPTGIGVLYGKKALLEAMPPYQGGGDMILSVTFEKTTYNRLPYKFEAGTPDIAGVIGLGAALEYVGGLGIENIAAHEHELLDYATAAVSSIPGLKIIGTAREKAGVLSFMLENIHPHDIGTILDREGIAIRTGHHCSQPVMQRFGVRFHRTRIVCHVQHEARSRRAGPRHRKGEGGFRLMSDLRDLYQDVILDHSKAPRNYREQPAANHKAEGFNPLCGDHFTIFITLDGDKIQDISFQGSGCAISKASASMMTQTLKGKTKAEAEELFTRFHNLVTGHAENSANAKGELGKLAVFSGVSEFPVRVKCATLAWHTLNAALEGKQEANYDGVAATIHELRPIHHAEPRVRRA